MNSIYLEGISKFKGWAYKGIHSSITSSVDEFSFTFLLAVSEFRIMGIMANSSSNTSDVFLYFLNQLWKEIYGESNQNNETYWLIMDNASIHKTNEVRNFFINKCLHAVTIPPNNPALNAAENVIQAIKAKIKQRRAEGR